MLSDPSWLRSGRTARVEPPQRAKATAPCQDPCPTCDALRARIEELQAQLAPTPTGVCALPRCDKAIYGKQKYCSASCRVAASRARKRERDEHSISESP